MIRMISEAMKMRLRCLPVASFRIPVAMTFSTLSCAERCVTPSSLAAFGMLTAGNKNNSSLNLRTMLVCP